MSDGDTPQRLAQESGRAKPAPLGLGKSLDQWCGAAAPQKARPPLLNGCMSARGAGVPPSASWPNLARDAVIIRIVLRPIARPTSI
jgi:hypothetical protein